MGFGCRYAVGGDKDDWAIAQAQVAQRLEGDLDTKVISIKNLNSTKRKSEDDRKDVKKSGKDKSGKKSKKSKRE